VLEETDGSRPFAAVHHYIGGGLESVAQPPSACGDGTLVTRVSLAAGARIARYDPQANRWTDLCAELDRRNNDNSYYASVGGDRVYFVDFFSSDHVFDLKTRQVTKLSTRVRPGSTLHKPSVMTNAWECAAEFSGNRQGVTAEHPHGHNGVFPPVIWGDTVFLMMRAQVLFAYRGQ
jgi:hypothetical protein